MGLEDFKSEKKTSSPTDSSGPSKGGVDEFIEDSKSSEIEVSGGFSISKEDQKEWETEVVKIFGGPGTGKTTTMVGNTDIEDFKGILQRMFEERNPEEVMLIAYTRAAADEAKDRLVKLTDVSESKASERVTTIHSLAMSYNNLQPKDIVEIRWANDKYNFCKEVGMEYELDKGGDDEEMMATPDDEGHLFFKMLSWLKSKLKPPSAFRDCPLSTEWMRGEDEFVQFASEWEDYKAQKGIWEFDDAILESVNNNDTIDTKYLFVDEVQDLYPLQQAFLDNQFGHVRRIFLAGDDDQCLPPTETVDVKGESGELEEREIQNVEVGDEIASMTGNGEAHLMPVTDVVKKDKAAQTFRTLTTESGKEITVTDNHKLFTRVPEADYDTKSDVHYVYLMRDDSGRWRVGETDNIHQRLNVERNARCVIPVEACDSHKEALLKETQYSLNYSIPTTSFTQRQSEVLSEENLKDTLYDNIEMGLIALQNDLNVNLDKPPLFKKATTRGRTKSLNIIITMCADTRNGSISHSLEIQTSNKAYIDKLESVKGLNKSDGKKDTVRFRKYSQDISVLGSIAKSAKQTTGGDIVTQFSPTERRQKSCVVPSKNVFEGMLVPVLDNEEVVFEEVVQVDEFQETTEVYDLTIEGTHNFSSNKVFTHNTIYEWAGAKPEYFLDMEGHIEEDIPELWDDKTGYWADEGTYILDQSWRMPNKILELAKMSIEQVSERQEKEIKPHHEGGEFIPLHQPDPERVIELINPDDTMILFRAKYQMSNFSDHLIEAGIPFKDRFKTWKQDVIKLRDALAALKNDQDYMTGGQASKLIKELPDGALTHGVRRDTVVDKFSSQKRVPTDSVLAKVRYDSPEDYSHLRRWCREFRTDDMNWYRERAVRNNLIQHNDHLDPSGIKLETIHGSKGREADTIILSTDSTQSVMENMPAGGITDAERRLYYVGMTRTKNRLVMCQGLDGDSPTLTLDQIIGEEWRDMYDWANGPVDDRPDPRA